MKINLTSIVFLPPLDVLGEALDKLEEYVKENYK